MPLLAVPFTVTVTATAPADKVGTVATMEVADHDVTVAVVEPNLTVLDPWVAPKLVPVMVTDVPAGPDVGFSKVIAGLFEPDTVNDTLLLAMPPITTVTPTAPVGRLGTMALIEVADHDVTVAKVEPNLTVLDPWVAPKLVPVIATDVPAGPDVGLTEVIAGLFEPDTVNDMLLLVIPPTTTVTPTAPVGMLGTVALIEVADQEVTEAVVEPNRTELDP